MTASQEISRPSEVFPQEILAGGDGGAALKYNVKALHVEHGISNMALHNN